MGIISYAQNFEDVLLWRALGHIEQGCYIDIGAHDPIVDSVSKAFYEHGWRGIHLEPLPVYCNALRQDRPDETVLQAAVAAETGVLRFYEIPDTGISTGDETIAQSHRERGFHINEITVPCVTLAQVFQLVQGDVVHWMKIDVEGLEEQVLRGWGESSLRPWVVVVESTLPLTQDEVFSAWEGLLTEKGYRCVHFDGLNRYYLAEEQRALESAFRSGPNVFDGFQFNGTATNTFTWHVSQSLRNELGPQIEVLKQQVLQHQAGEHDSATRLAEALQRSDSLKLALLAEQTANLQNQNAAKALALQSGQQSRQESEGRLRSAMQREQEFTVQLLAGKEQLQQLEQAHATREKHLQDQLAQAEQQAREESEAQVRSAMQREQELTAQLLASKEQFQQFSHEHAMRESDLRQQLVLAAQQFRLESEAHLKNAVEREQAAAAQQLALQEQAALALAQQALELQFQHDERRLASEIQEKVLRQEVTNLANEVQALRHANELQTQQHGYAMDARLGEHQRLLEAHAALESHYKAEIAAEQQTSLHISKALAETQRVLDEMYASWIWWITTPLRRFTEWISLRVTNKYQKRPFEFKENKYLEPFPIRHIVSADEVDQKNIINKIVNNTDSAQKKNIFFGRDNFEGKAMDMNKLFLLPRGDFIRFAYRMFLNREVDKFGLAHYINRLRHGCGRSSVVYDLVNSPEGKLAFVPAELRELSDELFVDAVFQRLLHRSADAGGKAHYIRLLKKGSDRAQVISDIERSPEAYLVNPERFKFNSDLDGILKEEKKSRGCMAIFRINGHLREQLAQIDDRLELMIEQANNLHEKLDVNTDVLRELLTNLPNVSESKYSVAAKQYPCAVNASSTIFDLGGTLNSGAPKYFIDSLSAAISISKEAEVFNRKVAGCH